MNALKKSLIFRLLIVLPFSFWGATLAAICTSWYHGYAAYFIYALLAVVLIAIPFCLSSYKAFYLYTMAIFLIALAFNVFSLVLLFFPELNGWNGWNSDGGWGQVYFQIPNDFSYWTLLLFLVLFLFFAIKKIFEIDYDAMQKSAIKDKLINTSTNEVILNKPFCMLSTLSFRIKFLAKTENWLYTIGFIIMCIVALPASGTGSSMARFGNNPVTAIIFFVLAYIFIWVTYWIALTMYAQYKLINKTEKQLGVKLKPLLKP